MIVSEMYEQLPHGNCFQSAELSHISLHMCSVIIVVLFSKGFIFCLINTLCPQTVKADGYVLN